MANVTLYTPTETDIASLKKMLIRDRHRPTISSSFPREDSDVSMDILLARVPDDEDFIPGRSGTTVGSLDCDVYKIDIADGSLDVIEDYQIKVHNIYLYGLIRLAQPVFQVYRTRQGAWVCEKPRARHKGIVDGADITAGSSGTVKLVFNGTPSDLTITAHLNWMHGGEKVSDQKEVVVEFYEDENHWVMVNAECEEAA